MSKRIIHKTAGGLYTGRTFEDNSVYYPSEHIIRQFVRNGVSIQKLLKLLYENKIDYKSLYAMHNKYSRIIFKNEIIKPIFRMVTGISGGCIYIKCKDSKHCDVFLMTGSEFAQIEEEDLFLAKTAIIAKRDKIDNDIIRFCKRLKIEVYIKEDCTKEVRQTIKNTKNVIKLKTMKILMNKICVKKYEYNSSDFANIDDKESIRRLLSIKENMSCGGLVCSKCPLRNTDDACALYLVEHDAKERLDAIIEMYKTYHFRRNNE